MELPGAESMISPTDTGLIKSMTETALIDNLITNDYRGKEFKRLVLERLMEIKMERDYNKLYTNIYAS